MRMGTPSTDEIERSGALLHPPTTWSPHALQRLAERWVPSQIATSPSRTHSVHLKCMPVARWVTRALIEMSSVIGQGAVLDSLGDRPGAWTWRYRASPTHNLYLTVFFGHVETVHPRKDAP